jgi:hypothetical protein
VVLSNSQTSRLPNRINFSFKSVAVTGLSPLLSINRPWRLRLQPSKPFSYSACVILMHRSSPLIHETGTWLTNISQEFCRTWAKERSWGGVTTCDGGAVLVMQGQLHIPAIAKAIDVTVTYSAACTACDYACCSDRCKWMLLCNSTTVKSTSTCMRLQFRDRKIHKHLRFDTMHRLRLKDEY